MKGLKKGLKAGREKGEREEKINSLSLLIALIVLPLTMLFLTVGCQPQQQQQSGLVLELLTGPGYVGSGKEILEDEDFRVGMELKNYDETNKRGNICVYDDIEDYFGGIHQRECQEFFVPSAVIQNKSVSSPGQQRIIFPKSGYYSYKIPTTIQSFPVTLTIEANYFQDSTFSSSLKYPEPETEQQVFSDRFLNINVKKSIHARENQYEIFMDISITKTGAVGIEAEGKNNSVRFQISALPLAFSCETAMQRFSQAAIINLERESFIRCSALTSTTEKTTSPLVIKASYVVKEKREIGFNVKKRWQTQTQMQS